MIVVVVSNKWPQILWYFSYWEVEPVLPTLESGCVFNSLITHRMQWKWTHDFSSQIIKSDSACLIHWDTHFGGLSFHVRSPAISNPPYIMKKLRTLGKIPTDNCVHHQTWEWRCLQIASPQLPSLPIWGPRHSEAETVIFTTPFFWVLDAQNLWAL